MAAPSGGGGGGGPVGFSNSFTGAAQAIEIIGDHAYAYSGFYTAADTTNGKVVLDFTTGNYYLVGELTFNGYAAPGDPNYGDDGSCMLKLNGSIVIVLKNGTGSEVMPTNTHCPIIIAPYTQVECTIEAVGTNADIGSTVVITGRIYR